MSLLLLTILIFLLVLITMTLALVAAIISIYQLLIMLEQRKLARTKKTQVSKDSESAVQKLRTLKKLYEDGAITEEEYNAKKKKYIDLL